MTSDYYNPRSLAPNSVARAEDVNAELAKIAAAFGKLPSPTAIPMGGGAPNYTHTAYADSIDGTSNFTTGASNGRLYVGFAVNQPSPAASTFPEDYEWSRLTGTPGADGENGEDGANGADGTNGGYVEARYIRSLIPPDAPSGNIPAGSTAEPPDGADPLWLTFANRDGTGTLTTAWSPWERISPYPAPGQYDATKTYYREMQVLFEGGTYILLVETSIGTAPTGTGQANGTWGVVAAPGEAGEPATPPSAFSADVNLTTSSTGVNLRSIADAAGFTGNSDATIVYRVPNGVTIIGAPAGTAIDTGTWPTSSYSISLTVIVENGGRVFGGGGAGGAGGSARNGSNGGSAGDAVYQRTPLTGITIDSGGILRGGGGGGAGGAGVYRTSGGFESEPYGSAGGGGGGGAPNGRAGNGGRTFVGGQAADNGTAGTLTGGGAGGSGEAESGAGGGPGGDGGDFATAGESRVEAGGTVNGGAAGYAVRRNGFAGPVTNNGSVSGVVG